MLADDSTARRSHRDQPDCPSLRCMSLWVLSDLPAGKLVVWTGGHLKKKTALDLCPVSLRRIWNLRDFLCNLVVGWSYSDDNSPVGG